MSAEHAGSLNSES